MAKVATDKMTSDMGIELAGTGISVVSLYPGLACTEKVMARYRISHRVRRRKSSKRPTRHDRDPR